MSRNVGSGLTYAEEDKSSYPKTGCVANHWTSAGYQWLSPNIWRTVTDNPLADFSAVPTECLAWTTRPFCLGYIFSSSKQRWQRNRQKCLNRGLKPLLLTPAYRRVFFYYYEDFFMCMCRMFFVSNFNFNIKIMRLPRRRSNCESQINKSACHR